MGDVTINIYLRSSVVKYNNFKKKEKKKKEERKKIDNIIN